MINEIGGIVLLKKSLQSQLLKTLLSASLLLPLVPTTTPTAASAAVTQGVHVSLDGKPLTLQTPPVLVNDAVYVPLREVLEACGAKVSWNASYINIQQGVRVGIFYPTEDHKHADEDIQKSFQQNGRWMIHIRMLKYLIGADVTWDQSTQTVHLSMPGEKLFAAIDKHNAEQVKSLLAQGTSPNSTHYTSFVMYNALNYAMQKWNTDIVQLLLEAGADTNTNPHPLVFAMRQGRTAIIRTLLDAGLDPNYVSDSAEQPLLSLVEEGYTEAVQAYLSGGPQRQPIKAELLNRALYAAIEKSNTELVSALLEAGADPNLAVPTDDTDMPPVIFAATRGNLTTLKLLLEHGADPNQTNEAGFTPLMAAAAYGNKAAVPILLEAGADLHRTNDKGATAWMIAEAQGNRATAQFLLTQGSKKSLPLPSDHSAIHPAKINATSLEKVPPLIRSVTLGNTGSLRKLLAEGADPTDKYMGATVLEFAALLGYPELVTALLNFKADTSQEQLTDALYYATYVGNTHIAEILLQRGGKPDYTKGSKSPMVLATWANNADMIQLLLKHGGAQELTGTSKIIDSVLALAAEQGNPTALKALLEADIDFQDQYADLVLNALYPAIEKGNLTCLELLLQNPPNQDVLGHALRKAVEIANRDAVMLLLEAGADPNVPTGGMTPLEIAKYYDHQAILKLLQPTP